MAVYSPEADEDLVRVLIEKGASVNATNDNGDSALNLATQNSEKQVATFLI